MLGRAYAECRRTLRSLSDPGRLLGLLALLGLALVGFGLAADLFGLGARGAKEATIGARQMRLLQVGAALLAVALALDLFVGRRGTLRVLKERFGDWGGAARFAAIGVQLALLVVVIRTFELESQVFYHNIMLLAGVGFVVHHFLPERYRINFFLLLSLGAILGVFGLTPGAILIAAGLVLLTLCHLPLPFSYRVALVVAAALGLGYLRMYWEGPARVLAVFPILASMFMFRLIIYLYDLRHQKQATSPGHSLSYFFLLPNVAFTLFPVIDFNKFRSNYYDEEAHTIYQRGLTWMTRGLVHLLLYRLLNYRLTIGPEEVQSTTELVWYLLSNFLLYLRISGQFHLVIGLLHLFGFNLPRTNHNYCFVSSFTDFWRRINIYWKDFMQKVIFFPTFFRLRKWGVPSPLVLSTIVVFIFTWFFHSYQWFWIRGSFLFTATDILFWTVLGIFVTINAVWEEKRKRTASRRPFATFGSSLRRVLSTVGTLGTICVLWALWTSDTVEDWAALLSVASARGLAFWGAGILLGSVVLAALLFWGHRVLRPLRERWTAASEAPGRAGWAEAAITLALVVGLLALSVPGVYSMLPGRLAEAAGDIRVARLGQRDAALLERGYYESLMGVSRFNSELWEIYMNRPAHFGWLGDTGAVQYRDDFAGFELKPSFAGTFRGMPLRVNRWGMRDRDYTLEKPAGTTRIAVIGSSHTMGSGVGDGEAFESILENHLNTDDAAYEVLNFAIDHYGPSQELWSLEEKALRFEPDVVLYVGHLRDGMKTARYAAEAFAEGKEIPYDFLTERIVEAGVDPAQPPADARRRLEPFEDEMLFGVYERVVALSRDNGAVPVFVFLPPVEEVYNREEAERQLEMATRAGFETIDLGDVYAGADMDSLWLMEWDRHPNAAGHILIGDRLYSELQARAETVFP